VTTFTLSDFGRTLQPSGTGTDHGWGNHHFIVGGAVAGGRIYGRFPLMTNYGNFNSTVDDYAAAQSMDQYAATLARWFGLAESDLDLVFPNLGNFDSRNLGFMG